MIKNPGDIVHFTFGEYSDLHTVALMAVIKSFNLQEEAESFVVGKEDRGMFSKSCNSDIFMTHLIRKEFVLPLPFDEVSLGGYDLFDKNGTVIVPM